MRKKYVACSPQCVVSFSHRLWHTSKRQRRFRLSNKHLMETSNLVNPSEHSNVAAPLNGAIQTCVRSQSIEYRRAFTLVGASGATRFVYRRIRQRCVSFLRLAAYRDYDVSPPPRRRRRSSIVVRRDQGGGIFPALFCPFALQSASIFGGLV